MKHAFILLYLLITGAVHAQSSLYRPFPTGGYWIYTGGFSGISTYKINGDTTIGATTYKRTYRGNVYKGATRESSKIVYFLPDTALAEHVLYDFNLTAGSTFTPFGGSVCAQNNTVTVYSIDSIQVSDGYHRRFIFSFGVQWIEGIGSTLYLLEPCQSYCVSQNDQLQCMNSNYPFYYGYANCNVGLENAYWSETRVKVFPNPAQGSLSIETGEGIRSAILINELGQKREYKVSYPATRIDLHGISPGAYLLRINDGNDQWHSTKIISY